MTRRSPLIVLVLLAATPAIAGPPSIRQAIDTETARVARAEGAAARQAGTATPRRRPNWIRRHPVLTGTFVGAGSGFLIGYLPGDDGVFYDFTAGFNGMVLAGVGAGAGASLVAIVQAIRR